MICKSLLFFFCYLVKYHEILLHHIAFLHMIVTSCTDYFLYILLSHCTIALIICMAHIFSTIIYHMNFYHIQCTLCFMYYKCYGTVHHYLLHSLLLKVYMYLISINFILFVQSYWLQFHMRYMLYL